MHWQHKHLPSFLFSAKFMFMLTKILSNAFSFFVTKLNHRSFFCCHHFQLKLQSIYVNNKAHQTTAFELFSSLCSIVNWRERNCNEKTAGRRKKFASKSWSRFYVAHKTGIWVKLFTCQLTFIWLKWATLKTFLSGQKNTWKNPKPKRWCCVIFVS